MTITGGLPDPGAARTAAEYVALLRRLKEHSGLTFRLLEQRAADHGDVLARSTLANVLQRDTLPRAEIVAALVRACGAGRDVASWLAARERIASGPAPESATEPDPGSESESESVPGSAAVPAPGSGSPSESSAYASVGDGRTVPGPAMGNGRNRRPSLPGGNRTDRTRSVSVTVVASLGAVALLVVGALVLVPRDKGGSDGGKEGAGPAPGLSRIRPARAPELCLTDGEVTAGGGSKVVAVQRPCAQAVPPRTYLLRADNGLYRVQWDHPVEGKGCLTLLVDEPFRNMLEPRNDCTAASQRFRIDRAEGIDGWRLRPEEDDRMCVAIRGAGGAAGAAAVAERCADEAADGSGGDDRQLFLIGPG
ncbi:helix-turn-helix domain-containing protein [Streptomyces sp. NPDC056161]|uniref:helix-turn-helix domain-containing protein n=1 Tax=Streptomyces sp. NPDC056161 TaxID=3345732 RepID=UPI0035E226F8